MESIDEGLRAHAQGLFVNRAMDLIGVSLLLYDHAITLASEVEQLWRHTRRRRSHTFFAFRYASLILIVATTALNFFDLPSEIVNYVDSACVAAIQIAVSALMIKRVYAIYGRDKRVLYGLVVYLVVGIAISGWAVAHQDSAVPDADKPRNGSGMSCLVLYVPVASARWMSAVWIILMVFDLMIFLLTVYKTMEAFRQPEMALSYVLLRDACMYFGLMVLLNVANVITYYTTGPYLRGCLGTVANSLSVTLLSRMMLNLYKEAYLRTESTIRLTTMVVAPAPSDTLDEYSTVDSSQICSASSRLL
ncbi:hypothetical protein GGF50DRAFT_116429 [Schizophyllum commune]